MLSKIYRGWNYDKIIHMRSRWTQKTPFRWAQKTPPPEPGVHTSKPKALTTSHVPQDEFVPQGNRRVAKAVDVEKTHPALALLKETRTLTSASAESGSWEVLVGKFAQYYHEHPIAYKDFDKDSGELLDFPLFALGMPAPSTFGASPYSVERASALIDAVLSDLPNDQAAAYISKENPDHVDAIGHAVQSGQLGLAIALLRKLNSAALDKHTLPEERILGYLRNCDLKDGALILKELLPLYPELATIHFLPGVAVGRTPESKDSEFSREENKILEEFNKIGVAMGDGSAKGGEIKTFMLGLVTEGLLTRKLVTEFKKAGLWLGAKVFKEAVFTATQKNKLTPELVLALKEAGFKGWDDKDRQGSTIAHWAAGGRALTVELIKTLKEAGFTKWNEKDPERNTIAHLVARHGVLTVDQIEALNNVGFNQWSEEAGLEKQSIAHLLAKNGTLTVELIDALKERGFAGWNDKDRDGNTVAHLLAGRSALTADLILALRRAGFTEWNAKDWDRKTFARLLIERNAWTGDLISALGKTEFKGWGEMVQYPWLDREDQSIAQLAVDQWRTQPHRPPLTVEMAEILTGGKSDGTSATLGKLEIAKTAKLNREMIKQLVEEKKDIWSGANSLLNVFRKLGLYDLAGYAWKQESWLHFFKRKLGLL